MLKPLTIEPTGQGSAYRKDIMPPPRICEACGKIVPIGHDAINVMIVVGSPGHPELKPFQCPQEEHWSCSPECWLVVAHACIDEHMHVLLRHYRSTKGL